MLAALLLSALVLPAAAGTLEVCAAGDDLTGGFLFDVEMNAVLGLSEASHCGSDGVDCDN